MSSTVLPAFVNEIKALIEGGKVGFRRQDGTDVPVSVNIGTLNVEETTTHYLLKNANSITFPTATTNYATVSNPINRIVIYKATGDAWLEDIVPTPFTYISGDRIIIPADGLVIQINKTGS